MILSQSIHIETRHSASSTDVANRLLVNPADGKSILSLFKVIMAVVILLASVAAPLRAITLSVPNASFESPVVPIDLTPAIPDIDYWQKSPQPAWYDPSAYGGFPWGSR